MKVKSPVGITPPEISSFLSAIKPHINGLGGSHSSCNFKNNLTILLKERINQINPLDLASLKRNIFLASQISSLDDTGKKILGEAQRILSIHPTNNSETSENTTPNIPPQADLEKENLKAEIERLKEQNAAGGAGKVDFDLDAIKEVRPKMNLFFETIANDKTLSLPSAKKLAQEIAGTYSRLLGKDFYLTLLESVQKYNLIQEEAEKIANLCSWLGQHSFFKEDIVNHGEKIQKELVKQKIDSGKPLYEQLKNTFTKFKGASLDDHEFQTYLNLNPLHIIFFLDKKLIAPLGNLGHSAIRELISKNKKFSSSEEILALFYYMNQILKLTLKSQDTTNVSIQDKYVGDLWDTINTVNKQTLDISLLSVEEINANTLLQKNLQTGLEKDYIGMRKRVMDTMLSSYEKISVLQDNQNEILRSPLIKLLIFSYDQSIQLENNAAVIITGAKTHLDDASDEELEAVLYHLANLGIFGANSELPGLCGLGYFFYKKLERTDRQIAPTDSISRKNFILQLDKFSKKIK